MLQLKKTGRTVILASVVAISLQSILCSGVRADGPAKAPATQPAVERPPLGDIDVADYCTVLLAPKLRTQLGANDAQREAFAAMSTEMKGRLDNCASFNMPGLNPNMITPGTISARIKNQLGEYGRKVRDTLTPEQDRRLVDLFNQGTLKTIQVSASIDTSVPRFGPNAGKVYRTTSYDVSYTHFGEAAGNANDAGGVPSALPKANDTPGADGPAASPRKRPRPNRPGTHSGEGDQPSAVTAALGEQFATTRLIHLPTKGAVRHMATSADGRIFVTAEDQMIRIWDCSGGNPADVEETDAQTMHLGNVRAIALSPDGTMLAVGGDDKTVRLYSLINFELKRLDTQISHDSGLWTVAFSPDGKSVISGADDLNVIWWNIKEGKLEEKSRVKVPSIFGIKYLAVQPKQIVTCTTGSGDVQVIDFSAAQPVVKESYKIPPSPFALPMAVSPADSSFLFGSGHNVQLKGTDTHVFTPGTKDIKCVAWSPDGKYFATGTDDGHLILWDTAGKIRFDYTRPTRFNDVTFIPGVEHSKELFVAAANEDGEIYLLRLKPDTAGSTKKN